ncbi:MAG TPA: hypothetical protein VFG83_14495 [Kofleriaceae bacterium]|nr:hypothetical protein [Kofleriaceae bacterium]
MTIQIEIVPGCVIERDEFLATHPPYSISLDGYVKGQPFLVSTPQGPYRNFNHHEAVDRSCTCATCEQVRRAVILGLYELYCDEHGPHATIWVNDCDQDICLATWVLLHPERASEPLVRALTNIEDLLDMSAGAFPLPREKNLLGEVRWVFEPYTSNRKNLSSFTAADMREVIGHVHDRIERFLAGQSESLPLLGSFRELGGGPGWVLVEVDHQHARQKMVEAGVNAAIELFARSGAGYVYSVWRRSEYIVEFPVLDILRALNTAEGLGPEDPTGWGGSETVGGSPRGVGSKLRPEEVERVANEVIARHLRHPQSPARALGT